MGSMARVRVREKMKVELAREVYALFAERGLDNVTAQEAAKAAGVSRATFFRYFASKEDAVVTALRSMSVHLSEMVSSMEADPSGSLLELMRRSFEPSVLAAEQDPEDIRARIALVQSTPALRTQWRESQRDQQVALAQALAPFCSNLRLAQTSALLGLTLFDHALIRWFESVGESLREILDEAFDFASMIDEKWPASQ